MKTLVMLLVLAVSVLAGEQKVDEQIWLNQIESVRQRGAWVASEAVVKLFVGLRDCPPTGGDGDFLPDGQFRWVNEDRTKGEIHTVRMIHTQIVVEGKKLSEQPYYWMEKIVVFELVEKSKK